MGYYLISSFSYNETVNSYNISITGKDKMCALNGEMGGNIPDMNVRLDEAE